MGKNNMKYRDIIGFSPKKQKFVKKAEKKVAPKPTTPPVTELLKKEFGPLNEWSEVDTGPKRWSGAYTAKDGLTEFERKGGRDNVNEGPAGDYGKAYTNVKKTYGAFWDSVHDFESLLKSKGLGRHAKELNKQYKVGVEKFYKFFFKMMDKLQ